MVEIHIAQIDQETLGLSWKVKRIYIGGAEKDNVLRNGEQEIQNNGQNEDILIIFRGKETDSLVCIRSLCSGREIEGKVWKSLNARIRVHSIIQ